MKTLTNARQRLSASVACWWRLGVALGLAVSLPTAWAQSVVKTIAGGPIAVGGPANGYVDGLSLEESQFDRPMGCAIDSNGDLFVADWGNEAIRRLDIQKNRSTTFLSRDHGLSHPVAIAFDRDNNLYIANQGDGTVRIFDPYANPIAITSGFSQPTALGLDGQTVYVTELGGALKRLTPDGRVSTITNGFLQPRGLAVLDSSTLAISENHAIRRLDLARLQADYLTGTNAPGFTNGPGHLARFNQPYQIARAPSGDLVVADRLNHCARVVDATGLTVSLYGVRSNLWESCDACYPGWADGDVEFAEAREPVGVAVARDGTVYTTEVFYHLIRTVSTSLSATNATNAVATVVISPEGAKTNNAVVVSLTSRTDGADLWYRLVTDPADLTLPVPGGKDSVRYEGPFLLGTSGTLFVRGFKAGFITGDLARADFEFTVSPPLITPAGAVSENPVSVTLKCATEDAELRWTADGSEPTAESPLYTGPFLLEQNGALKVKAFREGFAPSETVQAIFDLSAAAPVTMPEGGTFVNSVVVEMTSATSNAVIHFTLDDTEPTTNSSIYAGSFALATNATLKAKAFLAQLKPSPTVTRSYLIRVDTPVLSPDSGCYPNGVNLALSVQRTDATIYYTLDGADPTLNSKRYTEPFTVFSPTGDLRQLRARAFAPNTEPSLIASGKPVGTNSVGVPRDLVAGSGATIVVPVVVNLTTNDVLRSLQFRIEISPASAATPPLAEPLTALNISTNDFIPVAGPAEGGAVAHFSSSTYTVGQTRGLAYSAVGTNANFTVRDFGTVALLAVSIPGLAKPNDTYRIEILQPSGTSDGQQNAVALTTLPSRTITVANTPYLIGDSAVGIWYDNGDFGDGLLDNSDVNNAFAASLGLRVPFDFTDLFNAMDAFPEDVSGQPGGDGQIRYLDWQVILSRSLRLDPDNWLRFWTVGGVRGVTPAPAQKLQNWTRKLGLKGASMPDSVWYRQVLVGAATLEHASPATTVDLPVFADVRPGNSLAGLQFRAAVNVEGQGQALQYPVTFVPAQGMPLPIPLEGLPLNQVGCAWNLGSFNPSLVGSNVLGVLRVRLPLNAPYAGCYTVDFSYADGAPDFETQYEFETKSGHIWIQTASNTTSELITDEWKVFYFGQTTNVQSQADADPDEDGSPNWMEYLAGTHPKDNLSKLQLLTPQRTSSAAPQGVILRWLTAPGRTYILESTTDLAGSPWTIVATNLPGDGRMAEYLDADAAPSGRFYRVRLAP